MKTPIYAIPGLGNDSRILKPLQQHLPLTPIEWLQPLPAESISQYAARMAEAIDHPRPILLGVSFGGVMAQEIARLRPVSRLVLVSSIKPGDARPLFLRISKRIPIYRLSKGKWRIRLLPLYAPQFGVRKPAEIQLLREIFSQFDDTYRMWAIEQLAHWKGHPIECPFLHIHGTRDRVIPHRGLSDLTTVAGGNHMMIYQQPVRIANEIQTWLKR